MKKLKTAEEYWNENKIIVADLYVIAQSSLYKILAEHDKEIVDKIKEMIKLWKQTMITHPANNDRVQGIDAGYLSALTELLKELEK